MIHSTRSMRRLHVDAAVEGTFVPAYHRSRDSVHSKPMGAKLARDRIPILPVSLPIAIPTGEPCVSTMDGVYVHQRCNGIVAVVVRVMAS